MNYIKRKLNKYFTIWNGWCCYHTGLGYELGDEVGIETKELWIGNPAYLKFVYRIRITTSKNTYDIGFNAKKNFEHLKNI